jgi:hypothetical protein
MPATWSGSKSILRLATNRAVIVQLVRRANTMCDLAFVSFVQSQTGHEVTHLKWPFRRVWRHFGRSTAQRLLGGTIRQNRWRGSSPIARRSPRTPTRSFRYVGPAVFEVVGRVGTPADFQSMMRLRINWTQRLELCTQNTLRRNGYPVSGRHVIKGSPTLHFPDLNISHQCHTAGYEAPAPRRLALRHSLPV